MRRTLLPAVFLCLLASLALPGCGGGDASDEPGGAGQGGASASGGSGGAGPDAGKGGADAAVGDSAGTAGKAGAGGSAGSGGNAGVGGAAGTAGEAGAAGSSGQAGSAGAAGAAGSAGGAGDAGAAGSDNDAGVGGAAGEAGAAGASGTGGAAGSSGAGGSGGAVGCALPCHGSTTNAAPPKSLTGKTDTTAPSVGAHQAHLVDSSWHLDVTCDQCHTVPATADDPAVPTHMNGNRDLVWGSVAQSGTYSKTAYSCTGSYCHGGSLEPDSAGQISNRTPTWTVVDGSQSACGTNCHTLPPGGAHPASDGCPTCHGSVISSFTPGNPPTVVWANPDLHIDGKVAAASGKYHDLSNWTAPKNDANHHGSNYFLTNQQRDEHNAACTACHGADLNGGTVGVSCNNNACHKSDWKSCSFCHGTPPSQNNPPVGVGGETTTGTLAVGRHVKHLAGSANYPATACGVCHQVPATDDVSHAMGYIPSPSLATAGHHGDVAFLAGSGAQGMTWNVNQTQGAPVTARGTCVGGCHSNGRGGNPAVIPYWAGGTWTSSCGNCHAAVPTTNRHDKHVNGENMACTECHPAANGPQHMDGKWSLLNPIHGNVTTIPPGGVCGTHWGCQGTCHGEYHNPFCWNQ